MSELQQQLRRAEELEAQIEELQYELASVNASIAEKAARAYPNYRIHRNLLKFWPQNTTPPRQAGLPVVVAPRFNNPNETLTAQVYFFKGKIIFCLGGQEYHGPFGFGNTDQEAWLDFLSNMEEK